MGRGSRRVPPAADRIVELVRVRFVGGPLTGALIDLPVELSDPEPGRLLVTAGGGVYDRARNDQPVAHARVVRPPFCARAIRTIRPRPDTL